MDSEKFQELVLQQLKELTEGQTRMEGHIVNLEEGQKDLRKDVQALKTGYAWDDLKKIDARLSAQGEELVIMKRLK